MRSFSLVVQIDEPQFLQPVLVGLGDIKPFNITETDHLMAANRHVLKVADEATAETALFSLMASTWRHHGGVGNPAGARSRLLTVLVGDGVTIASEIVSLAAAYDAITPKVVGIDAPKPKSILEHMLWAQPWQTKQPVTNVAFPFIDCRRIRLVPATGDSTTRDHSGRKWNPSRTWHWEHRRSTRTNSG